MFCEEGIKLELIGDDEELRSLRKLIELTRIFALFDCSMEGAVDARIPREDVSGA